MKRYDIDKKYEQRFIEWREINSKMHKEYIEKVKVVKKDKTLSRLGRSEKLQELQKARIKEFFEIRMKYLEH